MACERTPRRTFLGVSVLFFAAATALTIIGCGPMAAMGGIPMPGGWTISTAWMPMPGHGWAGAAAAFLGMWMVMMAAMMLPSLVPTLDRYRRAVGDAAGTRLAWPTLAAAAAYFLVWTLFGLAVFLLGAALAAMAMHLPALARVMPMAAGAVVLIAGVSQFTAWKARHLACCRATPGHGDKLSADTATAWGFGLRLGLHCCQCCAGPMAVLLALGVMDLRAMAVVTAAITAERLAPGGGRVARAVGAATVAAGLVMMALAAGSSG